MADKGIPYHLTINHLKQLDELVIDFAPFLIGLSADKRQQCTEQLLHRSASVGGFGAHCMADKGILAFLVSVLKCNSTISQHPPTLCVIPGSVQTLPVVL